MSHPQNVCNSERVPGPSRNNWGMFPQETSRKTNETRETITAKLPKAQYLLFCVQESRRSFQFIFQILLMTHSMTGHIRIVMEEPTSRVLCLCRFQTLKTPVFSNSSISQVGSPGDPQGKVRSHSTDR